MRKFKYIVSAFAGVLMVAVMAMGITMLSGAGLRSSSIVRAAGTGTQIDPITISTATELGALATRVNNGTEPTGLYYRLENNITLSGNWTSIGNNPDTRQFKGHFDGNNKVISNVTISATHNSVGFFGKIDGGSVTNLGLENVNITGGAYSTGAIAGNIINGSITNSYVTGRVAGAQEVGGIVGIIDSNARVENCYFNGDVVASGAASGGIAGVIARTSPIVRTNYAIGTVSGTGNVGGIVGYCASTTSTSTIRNNMALQQSITRTSGSATTIGRVVGGVIVSTVMADNIAYSAMSITASNGQAGTARTAAEIRAGEVTPFSNFKSAPWTWSANYLPGLFGRATDLPAYLAPPPPGVDGVTESANGNAEVRRLSLVNFDQLDGSVGATSNPVTPANNYRSYNRGPKNTTSGGAIAFTSHNVVDKGFGAGNAYANTSLQVFVRVSGGLQEAIKRGAIDTFTIDVSFAIGVQSTWGGVASASDSGSESYLDLGHKVLNNPRSHNTNSGNASNKRLNSHYATNDLIYETSRTQNTKSNGEMWWGTTDGSYAVHNNSENNATSWAFHQRTIALHDSGFNGNNHLARIAQNGGFWITLRSHTMGYTTASGFTLRSNCVLEGISYRTTYTEVTGDVTFKSNDTARGTVDESMLPTDLIVPVGGKKILAKKDDVVTATAKTNNFFVQWDSLGTPIRKLTLGTSDLGQSTYTARFYPAPITGETLFPYTTGTMPIPTLPSATASWGVTHNVNIPASQATIKYNGMTTLPNKVGNYTMTADIINIDGVTVGLVSHNFEIVRGDNSAIATPAGFTATYGDMLSTVELPLGWTWDNPDQFVGNAGNNTFSATWRDVDGNYYDVTRNISVNVARKAGTADITFNGIDANETWAWLYDGEQKAAPTIAFSDDTVETTIQYRVNGSWGNAQPTQPGTHTIRIRFATSGNFTYGTTDVFEKTFTIQKRDIDQNDILVTIPDYLKHLDDVNSYDINVLFDNAFAYNQTPVVKFFQGATEVSKPNTRGVYTIRITMPACNFYNELTFDLVDALVIAKTNGIGVIRIESWKFDETPSLYSLTNVTPEYGAAMIEYTVRGENAWTTAVPTEAGQYTIRATWEQTDNYFAHISTWDFEISYLPDHARPEWLDEIHGQIFTYGDTLPAQLNGGAGYTVVIQGNKWNAGFYTAIFTLLGVEDQYAETIFTADFEIIRATGLITIAGTQWTYGSVGTPDINVIGEYGAPVVHYFVNGTWTATKPTAVGNYQIRVLYTQNTNWNVVTETTDFVITQAPSANFARTFDSNRDAHMIELVIPEEFFMGANGHHYHKITGQQIQYAIALHNEAPTDENHWLNDSVFEGLRAGTPYFIFVRFIESECGNYASGDAIMIQQIRTESTSGGLQASGGGNNKNDTSGLGGGAIAGVIGGSVIVLGAAGLVGILLLRRKKGGI